MKPINSKERTKQVWQFIFIFFFLAIVPVGLIFFAYYKIPEKLSDQEQQKLLKYSNFDRHQKDLIKNLNDIDSNINILVNENSSELPEVIKTRIAKSLEAIKDADTGLLTSVIVKAYNDHLIHANKLLETEKMAKDVDKLQKDLEECKKTIDQVRSRSAEPMP